MAKTSKTMPTKKAKKSTGQKTTKTVSGKKKKDAIDEPSSSPPPSPPLFAVRGKKDGIDVPPDNGGVLLNPHDVEVLMTKWMMNMRVTTVLMRIIGGIFMRMITAMVKKTCY